MTFAEAITYGRTGESRLTRWLRRQGFAVLPVYERGDDTQKGPRLYGPSDHWIAPDMLVWGNGQVLWIEAKRKNAFTWHRRTQTWNTGIDLRHYHDYCRIADTSPWPVALFFLQEGGQAKNSPPTSPAGLYGQWLHHLRQREHHRCPRMVYWDIVDLCFLAACEGKE